MKNERTQKAAGEPHIHTQRGYLVKRTTIDGKRIAKFVHVEIMEEHIGRQLRKGELIHHIDCNKGNNDIRNLWLCPSQSMHRKAHASIERLINILMCEGLVWFDMEDGVYRIVGISPEQERELLEQPRDEVGRKARDNNGTNGHNKLRNSGKAGRKSRGAAKGNRRAAP